MSELLTEDVLRHTFRVYIPDIEVKQASLYQVSLATAQAGITLNVNRTLPHRKIWALVNSDQAAVRRWGISATLNGQNIFKWNMAFSPDTSAVRYVQNQGAPGINIGGACEQVRMKVNSNVNVYAACPLKVNITCDQIFLDLSQLGGAGSLWDALLFVISQKGV